MKRWSCFLTKSQDLTTINDVFSDFNSSCILVITTYLGFRLNLFTTNTTALETTTTLISLKWFPTNFLTTSIKDMVSMILMIGQLYTKCVHD